MHKQGKCLDTPLSVSHERVADASLVNTLFIHATSTSDKNSLKHVRETKNI